MDSHDGVVQPKERIKFILADCSTAYPSVIHERLLQVIRKEGNQAYCASVAAISRALETGEEHTKEQLIPVLGLVLKTVVGLPEHQAVLRLLAVSCQGIWSTLVASLLSVTELLVFGLAISDVGDSELQKEGRKHVLATIQQLSSDSLAQLPVTTLHRALLFAKRHKELLTASQHEALLASARQCISRDPLSTLPLAALIPPKDRQHLLTHAQLTSGSVRLLDMARDAAARSGGISAAMEEAGPSCTSSQTAFKELLDEHAPLDEAAVARIIALIARRHGCKTDIDDSSQAALAAALATLSLSHTPNPDTPWNLDVVVASLAPEVAKLSVESIAEQLDHESFGLPDARAFLTLISLWRRATGDMAFPVGTVIQRMWKNAPGQIAFLRFASAAPPDIFTFEHAPHKLPCVEGLQGNKSPMGTPNQAWLALDLLSTLASLYEGGHGAAVRQIMELPLVQCPEVLMLGLASSRSDWSALARDVCDALVVRAIASPGPNASILLPKLWAASHEALLRGLVALYDKDALNMSRILDVCQELKALTDVLEATPFAFALELAALAARREYLNLEKWLQERLIAQRLPFAQAALKFLDAKLTVPPRPEGPQASRVPLSAESRAILLRVLAGAAPSLAPEVAAEVARLTAIAQGVPIPGIPAAVAAQQLLFPQDVEEEANDNFQKVYQGKETSDHLLGRLQAFKQGSQKEQQVYACMVHNLFDEYRFFPKYPEKERHITALLLGGLVQRGLVDGNNLRTAMHLMVAAIKEASPKMVTFGVNALLVCQERLRTMPPICQAVLQVPAVREASPELVRLCEQVAAAAGSGAAGADAAKPPLPPPQQVVADDKATEGTDAAAKGKLQNGSGVERAALGASLEAQPFPQTPPGLTARGVGSSLGSLTPAQAGLAMDPNRAFQAINAETLEMASQNVDYPVPPNSVQDKVAFHINNLSTSNLGPKAADIKKVLTPEHWPWFANYVVVKRAAQEPNFHGLYIDLMDAIGDRELQTQLLETTYKYVRILLRSDRVRTHSGERSLLKNLGSWLGRLTIARSKPVRHRDLDLKGIIYEAYEQGRMIAVLPFVNKVLEPCKDSKVFKPPNPWVQSILALVAEVYAQDKLKLNLKFEIELLFRNMGIQISDAKPSATLAAHKRQIVNNADFAQDRVVAAPVAPAATAAAAPPGTLGAQRPPTPGQMAPGPPQPPPGPPTNVPGVPPTLPPIRTAIQPPDATAPEIPAPALPGVEQGLLANLHNYVQINAAQLGRMAERCKRIVPVAVDRAIVELINNTVDKSVTTACMTTQELVLKDFAFEADVARMRKAAHLMVTSLAGSMALVSCRNAMRASLSGQLRALLADLGGGAAIEEEELDHAVNVLTNDNLELACTVIEKTATDKAVREMDERLIPAFTARQKARASGQEFMDRSVMSGRFPMSLPQALLPRGQLTPAQQLVYEDFARIPRTAPVAQPAPPSKPASVAGSIETAASLGSVAAGPLGHGSIGGGAAADAVAAIGQDEFLRQLQEKYSLWQQRLDAHVAQDPQAVYGELPREHELLSVVAEIAEIATGREDAVVLLARKIFTRLFEVQNARLHTGASVAALEILRDSGMKRLPVELTGWWVGIQDERKWRRDAGEALVRARMLQAPDLDAHLAKVLSMGQMRAPLEFAAHLVRACLVLEPVLAAADLFNTLETLAKLARTSHPAAQLQVLVDQARRPKSTAPVPGPEASDPPGLRAQAIALFEAFVRACEEQPAERRHDAFAAQLHAANLLKMDDLTERFFRILTELAVRHCASSETAALPGQPVAVSFIATDALARLVVTLVISHAGGLDLLSKVLGCVAGCLQRDAAARADAFNGRPYFRILLGLICELAPAEPGSPEELPSMKMLAAVAVTLEGVQPIRVPGFAFQWLELISHRHLMPKLVLAPGQAGWPHLERLLVALLRFLEPYLRNADLTDAIRNLYKGTLRVLLVLLHDFPEFLCEYHFELCNVVPPSCIQMRNLILSAFPRNMRLPDPFTPNLKVDLLSEITIAPSYRPEASALLPATLRAEVDTYMAARQPATFLTSLKQRLLLPQHETILCGTKYSQPLLNALVFYVGIRATEALKGTQPVMHAPAVDIFQRLASDLDTEGRYLFLNALANQLRFPNSHTHYFSCVLLFLFSEAQQEIVQEQITRVLLERLIVNRPHPWGLLITFIELIKNPRYSFWSLSFTHCDAEIERLFESVAQSCMGPHKAAEQQQQQGAPQGQPQLQSVGA